MAPPRPDYWAKAKITHTMADSRRSAWELIFEAFKNEIKRVLEVGSYEGQSALFWYHFLGANVTCIDTWENFAKGTKSAKEVEDHFDANTAPFSIAKIKQRSTDGLAALARQKAEYDLIYIDGDHTRCQVMIDSCLAWGLLRHGGFMVWDDYREYRPDLIDRPTPAIDAFVAAMKSELMITKDTGQQLVVRKK